MIIVQEYIREWITRHAFLKLLSATTFIQCCWRQIHARKEL
jgi:hypothetical protein